MQVRIRAIPFVARFAVGVALLAAVTSALGGCTASRPKGDPTLQGVITSVSGSGAQRTLLVVYGDGLGMKKYSLDAASVDVVKDTGIGGTAKTVADLKVGMVVNVWITGQVRESYPVQATASYLESLRQMSTSNLPTPPGLTPPQ